jgi:peroxiredoxin
MTASVCAKLFSYGFKNEILVHFMGPRGSVLRAFTNDRIKGKTNVETRLRPMQILLSLFIVFLSFNVNAIATIDRVAQSAEEIRPLLVGQPIPEATVYTVANKAQALRDLVKKKPAVLVFYRGGWCPYCNLQLKELKESFVELSKLGYQIIAISSDKPEELKITEAKHSLNYDLFSDSSAAASKAFGIAFHVDDETLAKYKTYNIDLEKASGHQEHLLPVPSVFIVSTAGDIQFEYVNPNYKVRLKKEILLTAARALLKADK